MENEITKPLPTELTATIKLTRNTKGYGWEIRILSLDVDEIVRIDAKMREKFDLE